MTLTVKGREYNCIFYYHLPNHKVNGGDRMNNKKKESSFLPDVDNEGKDRFYLDVDRMVNEGMAGGRVFMRHDSTNIEQSSDLFPEDPPKTME